MAGLACKQPELEYDMDMKPMPMLEYVVAKLASRRHTYQQIADGSGVPRSTVEKIARRETRNPGVLHVERLVVFFHRGDA